MKRMAVVALAAALCTAGPQAASAAPVGSTPAKVAAAAQPRMAASSCGSWLAVYAPIGGKWSRTYKGTCGHIDTQAKPKHYVSWRVAPMSSGKMCVRAKGYRWRDGKPYWAYLGCGSSGGGYVHWGKVGGPDVLGVNQVQGKSQTIVTGVPGYFTN